MPLQSSPSEPTPAAHRPATTPLWVRVGRVFIWILFATGVATVAGSLGGCVAMNIPSQRMHDPDDDGGLLGSWTKPRRLGVSEPAACDDPALDLAADPVLDPSHAASHVLVGNLPPQSHDPAATPPQVPWPRYHPVPTRPLLVGPPPQDRF